MPFDPDKYLAGSPKAAGGFDPDAYLAGRPENVGAGDTAKEQSTSDSIKQGAGDLAAGAARGAVSIGSTILAPFQAAINGTGQSGAQTQRGKIISDVESGLRGMGADTDSAMYATGKIGAEVAGTAGAGGGIAKAMQSIPALARFAPAVASGGFTLGTPAATTLGGRVADAAIRAAGGAISGGAATAMINPEDAGTGAMLGAAMPGGIKAAAAMGGLVGRGAKSVASNLLGATTGVGGEAIRNAYSAGRAGATEFLDNMRGNVPFDDVVAKVKEGLQVMRQKRGDAYRSGMVDISNDKAILDFAPIDAAMSKVSSMGSYKGVQTNKHASSVVDELTDTISQWKALNPSEYHTPEGLDALKQAVGDIRDTTQPGSSARKAVDSIYHAVKDQITAQAPVYSKVMKDYSNASSTLKEIERALSAGDKAAKDTAIRKLQSLTRNNVQTNYGNRLNLAQTLEDQGGVSILPAVSGQAMSSAMPRGIGGAIEKAGIGGAAVMSPASIPALLAAAPFTSPRLVGEALYGMGSLSRGAANMAGRGQSAAQGSLGSLYSRLLDASKAVGRTIPMATLANQTSPR